MKRRNLLLTALGLTAAGCARNTGEPGDGPVVLPGDGRARVASWTVAGGFVPPGYQELTAPRLAVYADGTAIADADLLALLTPAETSELVGALRRNLRGLPASPSPRGNQQVADAGTTSLFVLDAAGKSMEVSAYALEILDYPDALEDARDRMSALAQRVRERGQPYTAQRIRLVAVPRTDTAAAQRWPAGVPVPAAKAGAYARVADLSGAAAQAAMVAFTRAPDGSWPVFSTSDADNLAVTWRYLLPDE